MIKIEVTRIKIILNELQQSNIIAKNQDIFTVLF